MRSPPSNNNNHNDLLVPAFDASSRRSTCIVATFNLIATIVGGGVLSLPYAFMQTGIGLATILMILAAVVTDRTLVLLCWSARMTGASSYGELGRLANGPWMETFLSCLLFVFLLFVITAYLVLLRDIWTPLVAAGLAMIHSSSSTSSNSSMDSTTDESSARIPMIHGNLVLFGILVLLLPFVVQHNLHALRYNCFVGFASVSILCLALCHHGFFGTLPTRYATTTDDNDAPMLFFSNHMADTLFAFPIIMLSFLSHFNVLPIQAALIEPTRQRMEWVVHSAVAGCFLLMYMFGVGGYAYAGAETRGNILLNIVSSSSSSTDWMFVGGRVGVGMNLIVATPMMALPCRESALELLDVVMGEPDEQDVTMIGEQTALLRHEPIQRDAVFRNPWLHYGVTVGILTVCYIGAIAAPGVAIVWSLCGSSMAFLIGFVLPTAYYLQIQKREHAQNTGPWVVFSWVLLVVSVVSAIACTTQTISRMVL